VLLQYSIAHMSIVYTCNTYFVIHWSMLFILKFQVNIRIQYLILDYLYTHIYIYGR